MGRVAFTAEGVVHGGDEARGERQVVVFAGGIGVDSV